MAPPNKDNLFGSKKQASLVKASQLDSTVKEILASEQTDPRAQNGAPAGASP